MIHSIFNFFRLNRQLFIFKFHFFFFQAGIGPSQTAAPVYAQTLGFSSFVTGTIYTILPLLGLVIKPSLGALADGFKWHKGVMLFSEFIIMLSYFCIQFIPSGFTPPITNHTQAVDMFCNMNNPISFCNGATSFYLNTHLKDGNQSCQAQCEFNPIKIPSFCKQSQSEELCYKIMNSTSAHGKEKVCFKLKVFQPVERASVCSEIENMKKCQIRCRDVREESGTPDDDDDNQFQDDSTTFGQYQFYVFLLLMVGAFCGTAVTTTLADTICISAVDEPHLYGKQRLWGSIGYGVLSVISGLIVDAISGSDGKNYTPAFYLTLGVLTFDMVVSYFYINVEIPQKSQNIAGDVWKMLLNARTIVILVWCVAMGVSLGLTWTFLYWLLEDLAKSSGPDVESNIKTIEGLTNGVQTFLGETPAFFFAGWVITKIGHGHTMSVILFTIALRFIAYSFLTNPWFTLFIEPLQLYYGLFYSTMTSYANKVARPGTEATVQTLMCAACEGIGVAIGSFLGGIFYDDYGGPICFRIFGISFLVMAAMNEGFELIWRYTGHAKKQEQPT